MKVVFVDTVLDGHHGKYLESLCKIPNVEKVLIIPNGDFSVTDKRVKIYRYDFKATSWNFFKYIRWVRFVKKICKKENAEAVHFLDGDTIMKFMAIGFKRLHKKIFVTYHNFYYGKLRGICYRRNGAFSEKIVVHTTAVYERIKGVGVNNIEIIEYPSFDCEYLIPMDRLECKEFFGVPKDRFVVGFVGGISKYKGFDLLVELLPRLPSDVLIFVAGKNNDYSKEWLDEIAKVYSKQLIIKEGWLSGDEYCRALVALDALLLLYKDDFYGASGPLADGVVCEKCIITSGNNSLSDMVLQNHLGFVLKEKNAEQFINTLNNSIGFKYDEIARNYKIKIEKKAFMNKYESLYID